MAMIVTACSDELNRPEMATGNQLAFTVAITNDWAPRADSRSSGVTSPSHAVEQLIDSPLWLISNSSNAMDTTMFNGPQSHSRGTVVDNSSFYSSFTVWAYASADGTSLGAPYIDGEEVTRTNSLWSTSQTHFWPGCNYTLNVMACAPSGIGSFSTSSGRPVLDYTVPQNSLSQHDLLVATATAQGDLNTSLNLTFRHVCTAIRVEAASGMTGKVVSVALRNIKSHGSLDLATSSWSLASSTTDFQVDCDIDLSSSSSTWLVTGEDTFMMLPQDLGDDALLEVTLEDGTILQGNLKGTSESPMVEWLPGRLITYKISKSSLDYSIIVYDRADQVLNTKSVTGAGAQFSYFVKSIVTHANGSSEYVKWTAQVVEDDGVTPRATPSWMDYCWEGYGHTYNTWTKILASTDFEEQNNQHDIRLQAASEVGSRQSPVDLSLVNGSRNTANCYIVNSPGWYRLPLVYGNAIKNGLPNPDSYTYIGTYTGVNVLYHLTNHLDNEITAPYIKDNEGCVPASAELVWQEEESLVTDVDLRFFNGEQYLTFYVPKSTIQQGNAMVALKDASGTIMWSWHIWVTDYEPLQAVEPNPQHFNASEIQRDRLIYNCEGTAFTLMGTNLGWCDATYQLSKERSVKVRYTQDDPNSDASFVMTVIQEPTTFGVRGTNTYYQWGRKDPMCPAEYDGVHTVFKQLYPDDNWSYQLYTAVSIGSAIQHPNTFYTKLINRNHFWYDPSFYGASTGQLVNLWDNEIDRRWNDWTYYYELPVKTIYDPSPAGYCVPPNGAFTGLVYNGAHNQFASWSDGLENCVQQSTNDVVNVHGFLVYCKPMPAVGEWDDTEGVYFLSLGAAITVSENEVYPYGLGRSLNLGVTVCCPGNGVYSPQASIIMGLLLPRGSTSPSQGVAIRLVREQ
ncbi:MAG: fimbrillin family protein [Bacteroidales bacterium]|nr:fimbrillin family protein [Bacteroidales bacterium]